MCSSDLARNVSFAHSGSAPLFEHLDLDVVAGEKIALLCHSNVQKTAVAKVLAGLLPPTGGVVRYNDMNLVEVSLESIDPYRGLMLDSHPTLLEGSIEENLTLGRPGISHDDILWALHFVELDDEIDRFPDGLATQITGHRDQFTLSQTLRLLLARAIVIRPHVLIIDGTLHNMIPSLRETILRRLCSKDEPWSVIFVTNDSTFSSYVDRRVTVQ